MSTKAELSIAAASNDLGSVLPSVLRTVPSARGSHRLTVRCHFYIFISLSTVSFFRCAMEKRPETESSETCGLLPLVPPPITIRVQLKGNALLIFRSDKVKMMEYREEGGNIRVILYIVNGISTTVPFNNDPEGKATARELMEKTSYWMNRK